MYNLDQCNAMQLNTDHNKIIFGCGRIRLVGDIASLTNGIQPMLKTLTPYLLLGKQINTPKHFHKTTTAMRQPLMLYSLEIITNIHPKRYFEILVCSDIVQEMTCIILHLIDFV